ncbi:MAG: MarR family winged helix-turn-helix transcriptional regulator [Pseudomonadota bacterium]
MDSIDRIRAFNRSYLRKMGLLSRNYLGTEMTVTEARVLFELAHDDELAARAIAHRLDLDEGYLSRVLSRFEAKGWILRRLDPEDGRARVLSLTDAGRAAFAPLEAASRADIAERLEGRPAAAIERATEAMDQIDAALDPAASGELILRDLCVGDMGWLIQQHAELYARDEGFDDSFEPLVAEILAAYARTRDRQTERAFIACRGKVRLGSIFCVQSGEAGVAKLRLFLLVPEARGLGLGRRLLQACLGFAREAGYVRMRLWTHESHEAACALYAKHGFVLTRSEPVHSFGVDLVEQTWEIVL